MNRLRCWSIRRASASVTIAKAAVNGWPRAEGGAITAENVWTSVIEFNLWLRRPVALAMGGFDEAIGISFTLLLAPAAKCPATEGEQQQIFYIESRHRSKHRQLWAKRKMLKLHGALIIS